jgi:thiol:disulfide interchange protein DsbD
MKRVSFLFALAISVVGFSQMKNPIKWQVTAKTISADQAEIHIKAILDPEWHIWSQKPGDESLIPPSFRFDQNEAVKYLGAVREEGKKIKKYEEAYEKTLVYYENSVTFIQKVVFSKPTKVSGSLEYQICDHSSCLPPNDYKFSVAVKAFGEKSKDTLLDQVSAESVTDSSSRSNSSSSAIVTEEDHYGIFGTPSINCEKEDQEGQMSLWQAFLAGIAGGFLALFFPCTFPMIPMTMSFFLKGSGNKKKGVQNAVLYGFSIFLVYLLLSLPFLFLGLSGDSLNDFSTNIWVNLAFFVIFIYFAFSLFGYYDISMPSSLANKLDSKSDVGSFVGIFFMALTLAIVSFSCTGPILGLVLGNVKNAQLITPAMAGFGIGLGVPFAVFALFPNMLKSLPKSGSWLDVVKVVFGFVELAFAFKFLSNADLVKQWGFLKRELFVAIWILISLLCGLYLMGWFKLKKNNGFKRTKATVFIAAVFFAFTAYLTTDFFGGSLQYISGFPPPKSYSFFSQKEAFETHKNKLNEAMAIAKAEGKPLFIDFTGWACVNCRKMEENVWVDPQVYEIMKNKMVVVSLYVDEKLELPKKEQYFSKGLNKQVVTVGNKWSDFEITNLHNATQPFYAIIDPRSEKIINRPKGGYMSKKEFMDFLSCGMKGYEKSKK